MRTLLLTAMIFALNVPHARALDPRERQKAANIDWHTRGVKVAEFTRHLISGKSIILYFEHALDEGCSQAAFETRVLKYPEHGTIELIPIIGSANFPKGNARSKCNGKRVAGVNIVYQSAGGYTELSPNLGDGRDQAAAI